MTASHLWIGVEYMPASVVQDAASHPRPILCGNLADAADLRSALAKSLVQAEWQDLLLASPIGQGYLLDLLRQRGPIEHIVLALPATLVQAWSRATIRRALWMLCFQKPDMRSRV